MISTRESRISQLLALPTHQAAELSFEYGGFLTSSLEISSLGDGCCRLLLLLPLLPAAGVIFAGVKLESILPFVT